MNIYVGNLSLDVTNEELQKEFMAFGTVTSVVVMNDRYIGSGQTKGYGYVEMASKLEGHTAIQNLHGKQLKSRIIDVVEALPLSHKEDNESLHKRIKKQFNRKAERVRQ